MDLIDKQGHRPECKGSFQTIEDKTKKSRIFKKLLKENPHLKGFAENTDMDVFQVNAKYVKLLEGVSNAYDEESDRRISGILWEAYEDPILAQHQGLCRGDVVCGYHHHSLFRLCCEAASA